MSIDKVKRAIQEAPLFSVNASRLLQTMVNPDHELMDVVQIVQLDFVLTAKLLRVVNSPVFGLINPVTSIDRAIGYLGERMVVSAAMAGSVSEMMDKPLDGYEGRAGDLWRHDLFAAFAAREVSRFARVGIEGDLAYTGGLLHDIGKAIISEFLKGTTGEATGKFDRGENADYLVTERQIVGLDHAEVGYELAKSWELPEPLPQMIRYHHQPSAVEEGLRPLVYAVHLGDIVAMMGGYSTGSDAMQYQLDNNYSDYFELSADNLASVMVSAQDEFQKAEESLSAQ